MPKYLRLSEVRDTLGVSRGTLDKIIAEGLLTVVWIRTSRRNPMQRRIPEASLKKYLETCTKK